MDRLHYSQKPFSSRLYRLLARELFCDGIPIVSGEHAYFHLNEVRKYLDLDHLVVLQIWPRMPEEIFGFVKELRGTRNIAIVDTRPMQQRTYPEAEKSFYGAKKSEFNLFDSGAAASMNGHCPTKRRLPDKVYLEFAGNVKKHHGGVLEGENAEYHMRFLRRLLKGQPIKVMRVPPSTPEEVRAESTGKDEKLIVLDTREETSVNDWPGFYGTDFDFMLYYENMKRR